VANLLGSNIVVNYVDKRKSVDVGKGSQQTRNTAQVADAFVANAGGTTTTLVGANATPATSVNVLRLGEKFRLFAAAAVLPKEEKVFTVTGIAVAGSTTVTFTPAAAAATISTDRAKLVASDPYSDEASLDAALTAINGTSYSAANLRLMTQNDKVFAYRQHMDPDSI